MEYISPYMRNWIVLSKSQLMWARLTNKVVRTFKVSSSQASSVISKKLAHAPLKRKSRIFWSNPSSSITLHTMDHWSLWGWYLNLWNHSICSLEANSRQGRGNVCLEVPSELDRLASSLFNAKVFLGRILTRNDGQIPQIAHNLVTVHSHGTIHKTTQNAMRIHSLFIIPNSGSLYIFMDKLDKFHGENEACSSLKPQIYKLELPINV